MGGSPAGHVSYTQLLWHHEFAGPEKVIPMRDDQRRERAERPVSGSYYSVGEGE